MTVILNGDSRAVPAGLTLATLLEHLGLDPRMVVVEHNRVIVRKTGLSAVELQEGDAIELVHFVGGG